MSWRRISAVVILLVALAASTGYARRVTFAPVIDPSDFVTVVDNPYFPLTPGTTLIYEGMTRDGLEHVEDFVTHDSKVILAVTCTVVRNRAWLDDELIEETFDWYAQDVRGNVWYFGEFATEFANGVPINHEGSWEAGVDGALPGIIMLAEPRLGDRYRQEFAEDIAEDMAMVFSLRRSACVAYDCYSNLLVTKDWSPLEPGFIEHKYYAQGVGLVLEVAMRGAQGKIELIDIVTE